MHQGTHSSAVVSLGNHDHSTEVELQDVSGLTGGNIDLDGVVDLKIRVGVSDGSSIVSDGTGDLSVANVDLVDSAQLVLRLLSIDAVQDVSSLDVVEQSEAIVRLLQLNNIHETSRVVLVSADLSVDLHATFHADLLAFLSGQSILEALTKNDSDRQTFSKLVGTGRRTGRPDTGHLSEIPMRRRIETLKVLLWSSHGVGLQSK
mmetsp:Transcript_112365/g.324592  ORF Transcript_112365/g.324592 Transcript_112365/m.324592 type:complete len:204 (+) Transcript_112365:230-841(+)